MSVERTHAQLILGGVVFALICIVMPLVASAQTVDPLIEKFRQLQKQVDEISKKQTQPVAVPSSTSRTAPTSSSSCLMARTLKKGMRGEDVLCLQRHLVARGFLLRDSATGNFGAVTESAVKRFQAQRGIVSAGRPETTGYGLVGLKTRQALLANAPPLPRITLASATSKPSIPTRVESSVPQTNFYEPPAQDISITQFADSYPSQPPQLDAIQFDITDGAAQEYYASSGRSCVYGNTTVPSGESRLFYDTPSVEAGTECMPQERLCENGQFTGSSEYRYMSCVIDTAAQCLLGSTQIPPGEAITRYQESIVAHGRECVSEERVCANGVLSGTYKYETCTMDAPSACILQDVSVAHRGVIVAYRTQTVPYGETCEEEKEERECDNGTLSGTYPYRVCTVAKPGLSCVLDGKTLEDRASGTFYSAKTVLPGLSCASISQTRTCMNGVLSGNDTFNKATCAVASAESAARDQTRKSDLAAIQAALEVHRNVKGTYLVAETGSGGRGVGWVGFENGTTYVKAVTRGLYELGYLAQPLIDDPLKKPGYLLYLCNSGKSYSLAATLENPTGEEAARVGSVCASSSLVSQGKNYVLTGGQTVAENGQQWAFFASVLPGFESLLTLLQSLLSQN